VNRFTVRAALLLSAATLFPLFASACGSSEDAQAGAEVMSFELTDAGCVPNTTKAPAGPVTFEVENAGTIRVTEFEVLDGETILGEKENLSDGLSGSFSLTLEQGEYTLYCPGGDDERGTLTVTGGSDATAVPGGAAAIPGYRD
jgi:iron uptake system component EfeO